MQTVLRVSARKWKRGKEKKKNRWHKSVWPGLGRVPGLSVVPNSCPSVPATQHRPRVSAERTVGVCGSGLPRVIPGPSRLHLEKQAKPVGHRAEVTGGGGLRTRPPWRSSLATGLSEPADPHVPVRPGQAEATGGQAMFKLGPPPPGRHGGAGRREGRSGSSGNESLPSPLPPGREAASGTCVSQGRWHAGPVSCVPRSRSVHAGNHRRLRASRLKARGTVTSSETHTTDKWRLEKPVRAGRDTRSPHGGPPARKLGRGLSTGTGDDTAFSEVVTTRRGLSSTRGFSRLLLFGAQFWKHREAWPANTCFLIGPGEQRVLGTVLCGSPLVSPGRQSLQTAAHGEVFGRAPALHTLFWPPEP